MRIIIIGLGSIGRRHARNVRVLRPTCDLIYCDPSIGAIPVNVPFAPFQYSDWQAALRIHQDAAGVIIASPTECHGIQLDAAMVRGMPAYVEKPLMAVAEWTPRTREALLHYAPGAHVAVGYQYRFHVNEEMMNRWRWQRSLTFYARDNLIGRYGPTVLETMGSHSLDLALMALGKATGVALFTDGRYLKGRIEHERGVSDYDMRIDTSPRESWVNDDELTSENQVYVDALGAWLNWIETGKRDQRLATLTDGARVMDVMKLCKTIQPSK
jgi:predicted dehydrogenase